MRQTDPEEEKQRLTEVYAQQTDGELASVAKQAYELTDAAREALRTELAKRGLYSGQLDDISPPGEDSAEYRDLATVRTFSNLTEAELAKGLLEASGIKSFLFDENMGRIYWINVVGGIKLRVDSDNVEEANQILSENSAGESEAEESAGPKDNPST